MKKTVLITACVALLMTSCANQFNQVYKSDNYNFKYEYAKECYATGKYSRAVTLLQELVTLKKGSTEAEECLYMLAMAEYGLRDYETASEYFKKYYQTYPKGIYAENAKYYVGESLYKNAPEPRLDQSLTVSAIAAFQEYLDLYPDAKLKKQATNRLFALQDLLVEKEYKNAKLYYDLGTYFGNCTSGGNNYEASSWSDIRMQRTSATDSSTSILTQRSVLLPKSLLPNARNLRKHIPRTATAN